MTLAAASGDDSRKLFATSGDSRRSPCRRQHPGEVDHAASAVCALHSAIGWSIGRGRRRSGFFLADRTSADAPVVDRRLQGRIAAGGARAPRGSSRKG
jgi:hypothetical protein